VITDRTDLDDQLFDGFNASELLPEKPIQVTRPMVLCPSAGASPCAAV
jgi:hypothetical protein